MNSITYSAPSGVVSTPNVSFEYDAVGNRASMADGLGSASYGYNQLSQMTSETRTFTGLGSYSLNYAYNLAGQVTSITDPFGAQVGYGYDQTGKLEDVSGSGFPDVTAFATNMKYRAFGALKAMSYGNGRTLAVGYNARLQPSSFAVPGVIEKKYQYHDDGALKYSQDLLDARFDRRNEFDHAGRIVTALSGTEARGEPATNDRPYNQTYQFDAWNQITNTTSQHWSAGYSDAATYVNRRRTGWTYDAEGNLLDDNSSDTQRRAYDAAGRLVTITDNTLSVRRTDTADGDGRRVRSGYRISALYPVTNTYYLRSSMLGGEVVAEIGANGQKIKGYVRTQEGGLMAQQSFANFGSEYILWMHEDPASQSVRATASNGGFENNPSLAYNAELDPVRADAEREDPYLNQEPYEPPDENSPDPMGFGNPTRPRRGCIWNGMPIPDCSAYFDLLSPFDLTLADARRSLETYRLQAAGHVDVYENPPGSFDGNKLRVKTLHIGIIPLYRLVPSAMFFSSSLTTTFARSAAAGPQNTYTYLNRDQVSSLIDDVYKMFKNNPGCEEWTNKLLGELANSTGFDAGSIRDILEDFRQNGRVRVGQARGVRAGAADPALITLSVDSAQNRDAPTIMGEIIHSAGMPSRFPGGLGGYPWHYYTDEAMATAAAKFGTVMTAAQYRHTYPEDIKKRFAAGWQADFVEGSLAHGAIEIICNKGVNSLSPKYAKP